MVCDSSAIVSLSVNFTYLEKGPELACSKKGDPRCRRGAKEEVGLGGQKNPWHRRLCLPSSLFAPGNGNDIQRRGSTASGLQDAGELRLYHIQYYTQIQHMIGTRSRHSPYSIQIALLVRRTAQWWGWKLYRVTKFKIKLSTTV